MKKVETGKEALQEVAATPYHLLSGYLSPRPRWDRIIKELRKYPQDEGDYVDGGIASNMQKIIEKMPICFSQALRSFQARMLVKSILRKPRLILSENHVMKEWGRMNENSLGVGGMCNFLSGGGLMPNFCMR